MTVLCIVNCFKYEAMRKEKKIEMALKNLTGNDDINNNNDDGNNGGMFMMQPPNFDDIDEAIVANMLINYNEKFKTAGTILYRDNVIKQTISTLICKNKPNALFIGAAGVGKTKICEDIAYRLANNDSLIPDQLKGYTIYELPLSSIMAGSGLLGQLERKVKMVIDFISEPKNKAILFIDEIHQMMSSDNSYRTIAQILKPALARNDFHCIGATTLQESTSLFKDPAFNRRFARIIVDELTQSQTCEILRHSLPGYLTHYDNKFVIADDLLDTVVTMADQYINIGSHRPDNALTLLDQTIANEIVARKIKEGELREKLASNDPTIVQAAQQALQTLTAIPITTITESKLKNTAIRMMKGNAEQEVIDFANLREHLSHVKGQDDVIDKILTVIKNHEKGLFPTKKPITFLFTGTSGVGKTEVTKIIAETITGKKPIVLNMTEYSHSSAINNIIGSSAGFIGSDSKTELPFDCLESNPYQIILLDEFEKSHKEVQRLFMRVFDEGLLQTNRGTTIDFSKAIIIATTNAAHKEVRKQLGFGEKMNVPITTEIEELKNWFDAELINRFEHIINFNTISVDTFMEIIKDIYETESKRIRALNRTYYLKPEIDADTLSKMKASYIADFGARPAFNLVREYIESQI